MKNGNGNGHGIECMTLAAREAMKYIASDKIQGVQILLNKAKQLAFALSLFNEDALT